MRLYWDGSLLSVLVTESEERCSQRKGLSVIPRALKKRGALVVWRLDRPGSSVVSAGGRMIFP
jgi:hypothetical protein